jgi:hypothetical protein
MKPAAAGRRAARLRGHPARTRHARAGPAAGRRRSRAGARRRPRRAGRLRHPVAGTGRAGGTAAHAWGHVGHLQAVADTPRCAPPCGEPAARHRLQHPLGSRRAAVRQVQGRGPGCRRGTAEPGAAQGAGRRTARLRARWRRAAGRGARALCRHPGALRSVLSQQFGDHVLDATDAFSLTCGRGRTRRCAGDVVQAAREAPQPPAWRAAPDAAGALLRPGDAVCRQPRPARDDVPRLHTRAPANSARPSWTTPPLMRELLALRQEEAALLGHPPMPICRWWPRWRARRRGAGLRARPGPPRAALCRA